MGAADGDRGELRAHERRALRELGLQACYDLLFGYVVPLVSFGLSSAGDSTTWGNVGAALFAALPAEHRDHILGLLDQGQGVEAIEYVMERVLRSGPAREALLTAVLVYAPEGPASGWLRADRGQELFQRVLAFANVTEAATTAFDFSVFYFDILRSNQAEVWSVVATDAIVGLDPSDNRLSVGQSVTLQATVASAPVPEAGYAYEYRFSTQGNAGFLRALGSNAVPEGSAITTSNPTIDYVAMELGSDTVQVEIWQVGPGQDLEVGRADASVHVEDPFVLVPAQASLSCPGSLRLHLERPDGNNTLAFSVDSGMDYHVQWMTSGNHGTLGGGLTSTATAIGSPASPFISYECDDEETEMGSDTVTAIIYAAPAQTTDFARIAEATSQITIDNNNHVYHTELEVVSGSWMRDDGYAGTAYSVVRVPPVAGASRYSVSVYGVLPRSSLGLRAEWAEGERPPITLSADFLPATDVLYEGDYVMAVSVTGGSGFVPPDLASWEAAHERLNANAGAEVTVYFE
ncbi:MAG: hypothetical protein OXT09_16395 [Myxococcales bacterium]|nr:hypothetical protein [Myxococcales bacterium]